LNNLFEFVRRYSHVLVFIILQIICLKTYWRNVSANNKSSKYWDNSKKLPGSVAQQKRNVTSYFFLKEENDSLLAENRRLREMLYQMEVGIPITDSNGIVTYKKDTIEREYRYKYYAAKVLNNTFDEANNYLTINRGFRDGIKRGMAVIGNSGIVGEIKSVGPNHSVAASILSDRKRVSVQLKDGTLGYTTWDDFDPNYVTLNDIAPSAKMNKGDTVYTSGFSMFPPNVMVGRLAHVTQTGVYQHYKVRLSTNFRRLHYVYVVQDITEPIVQPLLDSTKAMDNPEEARNN
jgi:rod shape-determining protein MreC